ncbi:glutathione S-transferase N-terminal domain-containing protein [uncultured Nitratireductor sp.]|uniref:glutathione S-transferase N-terminal domain-containing protein n=1 Tax=uncultured Nitratireductor sp. TaxID=520953 RepID=UPI0025DB1161|nr:glutathione S-transferase N-terminal domain-containing protein [uncultured Nitratireductor sp.]
MKFFFAPEFSSLAGHIALLETGFAFDIVEVDIETRQLGDGSSYLAINSKGLVPALMLDDGAVLTENVAILTWIADQAPELAPSGALGRYRLLETLSLIAIEIHKRFPIYFSLPEDARETLEVDIVRWFGFLAPYINRDCLFGEAFGVADAYLFVMARGALEMGFSLGEPYRNYVSRIEARPTVQLALSRERKQSRPEREAR